MRIRDAMIDPAVEAGGRRVSCPIRTYDVEIAVAVDVAGEFHVSRVIDDFFGAFIRVARIAARRGEPRRSNDDPAAECAKD
ncbi:MAG TPA: hypothetical protein VD840_12035 [Sinorhizobium sp.]|nr:hypothetical protein [Sinorhizobium sp.]